MTFRTLKTSILNIMDNTYIRSKDRQISKF